MSVTDIARNGRVWRFLGGFVLLAMFLGSMNLPRIVGDGHEYVATAHAVQSHFSPDLRADDFDYLRRRLVEAGGSSTDPRASLDKVLAAGVRVPIGRNSHYVGEGYLQNDAGQVFSWHFWLYPALVAPALYVTDHLGMGPAHAFWLCNWAFVVAALLYLALVWRADLVQRVVLFGCFLFGGTTYYVWWTHPEIFTASLLLIGFMAFTDKRYWLALPAAALASTQNPPILLLLVGASAYLLKAALLRRDGGAFDSKKWVPLLGSIAVAGAIAAAPMLFYYAKVGALNPIAAAGASALPLMSLHRLHSLFFDLNLGMLIALPGVFLGLVAVALACIRGSNCNDTTSRRKILAWVGVGVATSIVLALPTLSTTNWNHGFAVFSRYAYWVAIPLSFALAMSMRHLRQRVAFGIMVAVLALQILSLANYRVFGTGASNLSFKTVSRLVLNAYPALYDPEPEVFFERLRRNEGEDAPNAAGELIYMYPDQQHPTKVLANKIAAPRMLAAMQASCEAVTRTEVDARWTYLNGRKCDFK